MVVSPGGTRRSLSRARSGSSLQGIGESALLEHQTLHENAEVEVLEVR